MKANDLVGCKVTAPRDWLSYDLVVSTKSGEVIVQVDFPRDKVTATFKKKFRALIQAGIDQASHPTKDE